MIPLRLVIDTHIVVSAALKPAGLQRTVLLLAITKPARLFRAAAVSSQQAGLTSPRRQRAAVMVVFVPHSVPMMGAPYAKKLAAVAIEYINAIAEYGPYFCEEPVPPENIDALAEVRAAARHPFRQELLQSAVYAADGAVPDW